MSTFAKEKPRILVSNDDGIRSPGLRAAVEAVLPLGDIVVVAPRRQQSAMGRGHQGEPEACLHEADIGFSVSKVRAYHLDASPAQTVSHALDVLFHERLPDLVVCGINYGENLGLNVTLSGTIGAALEGACRGVPALVMSLQTDHHLEYVPADWDAAAHFARHFSERILAGRLPPRVDMVKVDVPRAATAETPWRVTCMSRQSYFGKRMPVPSPTSRLGDAEFGVYVDVPSLEPDSDIYAILQDGIVAVTPLTLDMTAPVGAEAMRKHLT